MTGAVTASLRERLARLEAVQAAPLTERLLVIGRDTAARLPDDVRTVHHGDLLYGPDGVPRADFTHTDVIPAI